MKGDLHVGNESWGDVGFADDLAPLGAGGLANDLTGDGGILGGDFDGDFAGGAHELLDFHGLILGGNDDLASGRAFGHDGLFHLVIHGRDDFPACGGGGFEDGLGYGLVFGRDFHETDDFACGVVDFFEGTAAFFPNGMSGLDEHALRDSLILSGNFDEALRLRGDEDALLDGGVLGGHNFEALGCFAHEDLLFYPLVFGGLDFDTLGGFAHEDALANGIISSRHDHLDVALASAGIGGDASAVIGRGRRGIVADGCRACRRGRSRRWLGFRRRHFTTATELLFGINTRARRLVFFNSLSFKYGDRAEYSHDHQRNDSSFIVHGFQRFEGFEFQCDAKKARTAHPNLRTRVTQNWAIATKGSLIERSPSLFILNVTFQIQGTYLSYGRSVN